MTTSIERGLNNNERIPPLESGDSVRAASRRELALLPRADRLTRSEFERRYTAMPYIKKAELVEGVVYLASTLRFRSHGKPHGQLITWLGTYQASTPNVELADNATVRLDLENEPQPDVVLFIEERVGGQAHISDDDYIEGAPELVAEVAASSAANGLHDKKRAYRRNGVKEYIFWQILENKLNWFRLQNDEYVQLEADTDGVIKSQVFPGLWLASSALLIGDMVKVLAVLQEGLNSEEHAAFIKQLSYSEFIK